MFKLIAFAALLVCAAARPSILGPVVVGHGPIVHSIPAAISHQSHVQIHSHPVVVSPVLHHPLPIVHGPIVHPAVVAGPLLGPHPVWWH